MVRSEFKTLKPLYDQFVCVRVLQMNDANVRLFQFDFDTTWFTFFLGPDETIIARYGGRDGKDAEARLSVAGFRYTMKLALDEHKAAKTDDAPPPPPAFKREPFQTGKRGCLHCHQVWEGLRRSERSAGTFEDRSLYVYPPPENVGLTLSVDEGNTVTAVKPNSPAARAGLRKGDVLEKVHQTRTFSQGDVMYGLHTSPAAGAIAVKYRRDGTSTTVDLELPKDWRKTDLSWRASMRMERMPK